MDSHADVEAEGGVETEGLMLHAEARGIGRDLSLGVVPRAQLPSHGIQWRGCSPSAAHSEATLGR